jgi:hypothetical protein
MEKGLRMCYIVIFFTFYSAATSGYWAFGKQVDSNVLMSLMPDIGPSLAPTWLLGLIVVFVLLQLFAIGLVNSFLFFFFFHFLINPDINIPLILSMNVVLLSSVFLFVELVPMI